MFWRREVIEWRKLASRTCALGGSNIADFNGIRSRNGKNRTLRPSKDIRLKENAPELDYSSFYVTTGMGHTGCLVAQDLALLIKVRTLIHEEISLLTVLYFPFRARTPIRTSRWNGRDSTRPPMLGLTREDDLPLKPSRL
jgi:hypothetical protein